MSIEERTRFREAVPSREKRKEWLAPSAVQRVIYNLRVNARQCQAKSRLDSLHFNENGAEGIELRENKVDDAKPNAGTARNNRHAGIIAPNGNTAQSIRSITDPAGNDNVYGESSGSVRPIEGSAKSVRPNEDSAKSVSHNEDSAKSVRPNEDSAGSVGPNTASVRIVKPKRYSEGNDRPEENSAKNVGPGGDSGRRARPKRDSNRNERPSEDTVKCVGLSGDSGRLVRPKRDSDRNDGPNEGSAKSVGPEEGFDRSLTLNENSPDTVTPNGDFVPDKEKLYNDEEDMKYRGMWMLLFDRQETDKFGLTQLDRAWFKIDQLCDQGLLPYAEASTPLCNTFPCTEELGCIWCYTEDYRHKHDVRIRADVIRKSLEVELGDTEILYLKRRKTGLLYTNDGLSKATLYRHTSDYKFFRKKSDGTWEPVQKTKEKPVELEKSTFARAIPSIVQKTCWIGPSIVEREVHNLRLKAKLTPVRPDLGNASVEISTGKSNRISSDGDPAKATETNIRKTKNKKSSTTDYNSLEISLQVNGFRRNRRADGKPNKSRVKEGLSSESSCRIGDTEKASLRDGDSQKTRLMKSLLRTDVSEKTRLSSEPNSGMSNFARMLDQTRPGDKTSKEFNPIKWELDEIGYGDAGFTEVKRKGKKNVKKKATKEIQMMEENGRWPGVHEMNVEDAILITGNVEERDYEGVWTLLFDKTEKDSNQLTQLDRAWFKIDELCEKGFLKFAEASAAEYIRHPCSETVGCIRCYTEDYRNEEDIQRRGDLIRETLEAELGQTVIYHLEASVEDIKCLRSKKANVYRHTPDYCLWKLNNEDRKWNLVPRTAGAKTTKIVLSNVKYAAWMCPPPTDALTIEDKKQEIEPSRVLDSKHEKSEHRKSKPKRDKSKTKTEPEVTKQCSSRSLYTGKWMLFLDDTQRDLDGQTQHDRAWFKIEELCLAKLLSSAHASTATESQLAHIPGKGCICCCTRDYRDEEDVNRTALLIRKTLENELQNKAIYYKTDSATRARKYSNLLESKPVSLYRQTPDCSLWKRNLDEVSWDLILQEDGSLTVGENGS